MPLNHAITDRLPNHELRDLIGGGGESLQDLAAILMTVLRRLDELAPAPTSAFVAPGRGEIDVPGTIEESTAKFAADIRAHGALAVSAALAMLLDATADLRVDVDRLKDAVGLVDERDGDDDDDQRYLTETEESS